MSKMYLAAAAGLAACVSFTPSEASAATIRALAIATDTTSSDAPATCNQSTAAPMIDCAISGSNASSASSASSFANAETGEMGAYIENTGKDFTTQASATMVEGFTVTTGGAFTFSVRLEGSSDIEDNPSIFEPERYDVTTHLVVTENDIFGPALGTTGVNFDLSTNALQDTVDRTRAITLLLDPGHYVLEADLIAVISAGTSGILDFLHTATIFVETLDGAFTFDTAGFLSNPGFFDNPSEVPLPAAFPLMLAGLAGLSVAARRRGKAARI